MIPVGQRALRALRVFFQNRFGERASALAHTSQEMSPKRLSRVGIRGGNGACVGNGQIRFAR